MKQCSYRSYLRQLSHRFRHLPLIDYFRSTVYAVRTNEKRTQYLTVSSSAKIAWHLLDAQNVPSLKTTGVSIFFPPTKTKISRTALKSSWKTRWWREWQGIFCSLITHSCDCSWQDNITRAMWRKPDSKITTMKNKNNSPHSSTTHGSWKATPVFMTYLQDVSSVSMFALTTPKWMRKVFIHYKNMRHGVMDVCWWGKHFQSAKARFHKWSPLALLHFHQVYCK